ncbi:MAG: prolyl oligopeptidase family serine peptidase [Roseobacter sp.]
MRFSALIAVFLSVFALPAVACGPNSNCMVGERHYRIAMPSDHDGATPVPVIIFAHGFRGTAQGVMRNRSLRQLSTELGAALIAVKSDGPGWNLPYGPRTFDSDGSAEFSYFDAVLEDAAARYPLDEKRVMVSGFSAGGMMVWNLACARPERFAGFAPIAGTFWLKPPETCDAPVANVIHIHGDKDTTVPLLGRAIGETKQGQVPKVLEMYGDFGAFNAPTSATYAGLSCKEQKNAQGDILDFCLFSGGHSFRTEHVRHAWERLIAAGRM